MDEEQKKREKRLPESSPPGLLFTLMLLTCRFSQVPKQETKDGYGFGHVVRVVLIMLQMKLLKLWTEKRRHTVLPMTKSRC
jgi:hypothetical protein